MTAGPVLRPDLCVIGAGSGGLSVAAGAVQLGASVVLIEGAEMGGDCLNFGCVPSKSLLAAAKAAQAHRTSAPFGVAADNPATDYAAAMDHVHRVIAAIAPHDGQERFERLGVTVIRDWARFVGPRALEAGDCRIAARRFVIATGSSPAAPPIAGLDETFYLTNETLWNSRILPSRLLVIGGGPIGLEMAQAHRRLGSEVVVLEAATALAKDDPETAAIAIARLRAEGVDLREETRIASVRNREGGGVVVALENGETVEGSHLLVAAGRRPNVAALNLAAAEVQHDGRGVTVDRGLRSVSNRRVYAVGDVAGGGAGGLQFTHVAGYHAGLVVRSALFRLPVRVRPAIIPWVTYTDPEIAQAGLTERQARERRRKVEVAHFAFAENDRARAELRTDGLIKAVIGRRGRILGCSIVGADAGLLIQPWALALSKGLSIGDMAAHVAPYPTVGEVSKGAASAYFAPRLFSNRSIRLLVRLLAHFG